MTNQPKLTKRMVRQAIEGSDGNVVLIARRLKVARQTVYNYLNKHDDLRRQRDQEERVGNSELVALAKSKLRQGIENDDRSMIMFALRQYDRTATGANDLDSLFSPDILAIMAQMGMEPSEVVKEFEALIRAQAEVKRDGGS